MCSHQKSQSALQATVWCWKGALGCKQLSNNSSAGITFAKQWCTLCNLCKAVVYPVYSKQITMKSKTITINHAAVLAGTSKNTGGNVAPREHACCHNRPNKTTTLNTILSSARTLHQVLCLVYRSKIKARKFRVDGFTIEAFACQLHLGDITAVLPEEEEDPGKHARPPTDPTDRHSPSPGTTSGTTQSAPGGSSPDEPPIQGQLQPPMELCVAAWL